MRMREVGKMKEEEEWSFAELQIHAKGYLRGVLVGMCLTLLLTTLGINLYLLLKI